ncbi:MAG: RNA polymerase sporulation sigma factor SigK [Eubacteriales bacterium]
MINIISMLFNFFAMFLRVSQTNSFPQPLEPAEEAELFRRMKAGDDSARSTLIEHNLRLCAHIVKKYYIGAKNQDDLISIGTIGLIKAIDSFDVSNGARFATYAAKCVQNEILMYFRSQKKLSAEVSINETLDYDRDGNPLTYIDIIACDDTIADDLDLRLRSEKAISIIKNRLTPRERAIIVLRYGLGKAPPATQREIAARLGISRSYVSRIEKSALDKIKDSL